VWLNLGGNEQERKPEKLRITCEKFYGEVFVQSSCDGNSNVQKRHKQLVVCERTIIMYDPTIAWRNVVVELIHLKAETTSNSSHTACAMNRLDLWQRFHDHVDQQTLHLQITIQLL